MARTRIISQNKAVFASDTDGANPSQIHRVDTFSFEVDQAAAREDIREFGQLARIATELTSEITPTVSFGYFLGEGENEINLGLTSSASNQFISNILTEDAQFKERNLYVTTVDGGLDAFSAGGWASDSDTVSFGNVTLTSYNANFSVGEIPRVDIEAECSNVTMVSSTQPTNPAVDENYDPIGGGAVGLPQPDTGDMSYAVLRPQDVTVTFVNDEITAGGNLGVDFATLCVQSASVEVPLARENIECLGSKRGTKYLEFPINVTVNINANVKDFKDGALSAVLTGTAGDDTTDIVITVKNKSDTVVHTFTLKKAVLDSQSFSAGLDDAETVDLVFSAQIAGADTTDVGLFWVGLAG